MGWPLVALLLFFGVAMPALIIWISYRLAIVAIRTAILEADDERAKRARRAALLQRKQ